MNILKHDKDIYSNMHSQFVFQLIHIYLKPNTFHLDYLDFVLELYQFESDLIRLD